MDMHLYRRKRLQTLIDDQFKGDRRRFCDASGLSESRLAQLLSGSYREGKGFGEKAARTLEMTLQLPTLYFDLGAATNPTDLSTLRGGTMEMGQREGDFPFLTTDQFTTESCHIEIWPAKGSCGGGASNIDSSPKGHLVKETAFFKKRGLNPSDAFALYADGNSMANFIVDGDLVIFNKAKTEPVSGEIFAIEHPDGLRVKRLRRKINGMWILENDSPDKQKYPDEEISQENSKMLKIRGQFVFRQGG
jgi:hypothetical protein